MKMINKSECEYKGGYIVCNGEVVCIDNEIVDLLNKLDTDVQRAQWEATNHPTVAMTPVEEFSPESEHGAIYPVISASTPELDKMVENSLKIMEEIDSVHDTSLANEYIEGILPIIQFVNDDFIVSGEQATQHRFDLPVIGNPLELDKDAVVSFVVSMFE